MAQKKTTKSMPKKAAKKQSKRAEVKSKKAAKRQEGKSLIDLTAAEAASIRTRSDVITKLQSDAATLDMQIRLLNREMKLFCDDVLKLHGADVKHKWNFDGQKLIKVK